MMMQPPPTKKGAVTEREVCKALPDLNTCSTTIGIGWALSNFSEEEVFIGHYKVKTMDLPLEAEAKERFLVELQNIERTIRERNAKVGVREAYPYLLPSRTPTNIAI